MRTINVPLEDGDYAKVYEAKKKYGKGWREFVMLLADWEN